MNVPVKPEGEAHIPLLYTGIFSLLLFLFFTFNIWNYDLWHTDEARFAQVSREMMVSGNYLSPHVNEQVYREKPPLLFWLISFISMPFGDVTGESARAALALVALATVGCTYVLARDMFDRRTALWAVVILSTSWRFFWQARTVQIDMLITACTTAALLMLWRWHRKKEAQYLVLFYLAIGFGMLAKGPPALIFPLLTIITFYWKQKEARKATRWVIGFLASICVLLAWLIPARMSVSEHGSGAVEIDILNNIYRQTIGRMFEGVGHAEPPWFYLHSIPTGLMPWAFLLPLALAYSWKRRKDSEAHKLLLSWTVPAFIFFSACAGKRSVYLLPILPALAVSIAAYWTSAAPRLTERVYKNAGYSWASLLTILACAVGYFMLLPNTGLDLFPLAICLLSLIGLAIHAWRTAWKSPLNFRVLFAVHIVVVYLLIAFAYFPIRNEGKSVRAFCQPLYDLAQENQPYTLYAANLYHLGYNFYSDHSFESILPSQTALKNEPFFIVHQFKGIAKSSGLSLDEALDQGRVDSLLQKTLALRDTFNLNDPASPYAWLTAEINVLVEQYTASTPVFIAIEEVNLIWLGALEPALFDYTVLEYGHRGSKTLILLGNPAATALGINPEENFRPDIAHLSYTRSVLDTSPEGVIQ